MRRFRQNLVPGSALVLPALLLVLSAAGHAGSLFVEGSGNQFGTLDLSTGNFSGVGTTTPLFFGMGFSGGNLYGLDSASPANVFRIDPATANTTQIPSTNNLDAIAGTAGPNGLLYALDDTVSELYTVNPVTGTKTNIGLTGIGLPDGLLAFDPSGHLFADAFDPTGDFLYQLDPATGAATPIGSIGGVGSTLHFFSGVFVGGTLYGFASQVSGAGIYSIDTTTGAATLLTTYNMPLGADIDAVALSPVPEPSGLAVLALGLLAWRRFRPSTAAE